MLRSRPHHANTPDESLSRSVRTQAAIVRALVVEVARCSSSGPRSVALCEQLKEERERLPAWNARTHKAVDT